MPVKRPFCKVCHDAGKPESEYTSHWVKDLTGKTICPTLLNTECRYCYKLGHTAKFCNVLAKNNKEREKAERRQTGSKVVATRKLPAPAFQKKSANIFATLCEDSDSEEEVSNNIVQSGTPEGRNARLDNEYPVLCESAKKVVTEVKSNWVAIAAKPKLLEVPRESGFVSLSDYIKKAPEPKPVVGANRAPWASQPKVSQMRSWADWSDSEDEEDDLPPVKYYDEVEDDTW